MQNLKKDIHHYLKKNLGISLNLSRWKGDEQLPFFLQDQYDFLQGRLLDTLCIFMVDRAREMESPARLRKHIHQVEKVADFPIVYIRSDVTPYNRKRLIDHKVPFIVPDNQMYLPLLGIDLREHFKSLPAKPKTFSPCAQAVLIYTLLKKDGFQIPSSELKYRLNYSTMSIKRAFDEIQSAGIGKPKTIGRERCLQVDTGKKKVWDKALPFLRTPVKKRHFIVSTHAVQEYPRAGFSALAQHSMLASPPMPVIAVSGEMWQKLEKTDSILIVPDTEPDAIEIEVWRYDPNLFAENGLVDRLSLYLSLQDSQDERVESALQEMMEDIEW